MRKAHSILFVCLIAVVVGLGCEDDVPDLPPPSSAAPPPPVKVDAKGVARIKADRLLTVPKVALFLRVDPTAPGRMAVTLKSMEPAPDGTRFVFGSIEWLGSLEELMRGSVDMSTAPVLDSAGNGVFTTARAYQPKLASLVVTERKGDEVSGKVSGDFNLFQLSSPRAKPEVVDLEISFSATLVILD